MNLLEQTIDCCSVTNADGKDRGNSAGDGQWKRFEPAAPDITKSGQKILAGVATEYTGGGLQSELKLWEHFRGDGFGKAFDDADAGLQCFLGIECPRRNAAGGRRHGRQFGERELSLIEPDREQAGFGNFAIQLRTTPGFGFVEATLNGQVFYIFNSQQPEDLIDAEVLT